MNEKFIEYPNVPLVGYSPAALREIRLSRGISVRDISNATGASMRSINSYQAGKTEPKAGTLAAIGRALGIRWVL